MTTERSTPVTISEAYMADRDHDRVVERETVVVNSGGGSGAGGVIAAIALLILVVAVLAYFGMLPI